jgi:hypothetical protein
VGGGVAVRAAALQRRRILGIQPSIDVPTMVGLLTRRPTTIVPLGWTLAALKAAFPLRAAAHARRNATSA